MVAGSGVRQQRAAAATPGNGVGTCAAATPGSGVRRQRRPLSGARSTSSGGAQSLYIVSIYPYHVYSGPGPVTGASTGRQDGLYQKILLSQKWVARAGKGLNKEKDSYLLLLVLHFYLKIRR